MKDERCPVCLSDSPADCMRGHTINQWQDAAQRLYLDLCKTEARALAAEGRLRTVDRMAHSYEDRDSDDETYAIGDSGWMYRKKKYATIGDLADAWAAAHKEG